MSDDVISLDKRLLDAKVALQRSLEELTNYYWGHDKPMLPEVVAALGMSDERACELLTSIRWLAARMEEIDQKVTR